MIFSISVCGSASVAAGIGAHWKPFGPSTKPATPFFASSCGQQWVQYPGRVVVGGSVVGGYFIAGPAAWSVGAELVLLAAPISFSYGRICAMIEVGPSVVPVLILVRKVVGGHSPRSGDAARWPGFIFRQLIGGGASVLWPVGWVNGFLVALVILR